MVLGFCVDMGVAVVTGLVVGGIRVAGWTTVGLYVGSGELETRGVVARSRGLLGLGSGLISSGSRLIPVLWWGMLTRGGRSYSWIGGTKGYTYSFVTRKISIDEGGLHTVCSKGGAHEETQRP